MKYHKIKNVPLEVCTAEQKIAYNLAWSWGIDLAKSGKFSMWPDISRTLCEWYRNSADYKPGKFDLDAIFCALNAGMENYCKRKYKILTSYSEIGAAFPAHYLNREAV